MTRRYIQSYGPNPDAIRIAMNWASQQSGPVLLGVPQKSTLEGTIETVIGQPAVKALKKGDSAPNGSSSLTLFTQRDRRASWNGSVLAIYPTRELLDRIDGFRPATVLVVPWTEDEIRFWIDTWSAQPLDAAAPQQKKQARSLDPIVENALRDLSNSVNVSTGLAHPLDRASAIELFEVLREARVGYTPEAVRAWLITEGGWKPHHANQVEKVCAAILDGRRLKADRRETWRNSLSRWRAPTP